MSALSHHLLCSGSTPVTITYTLNSRNCIRGRMLNLSTTNPPHIRSLEEASFLATSDTVSTVQYMHASNSLDRSQAPLPSFYHTRVSYRKGRGGREPGIPPSLPPPPPPPQQEFPPLPEVILRRFWGPRSYPRACEFQTFPGGTYPQTPLGDVHVSFSPPPLKIQYEPVEKAVR